MHCYTTLWNILVQKLPCSRTEWSKLNERLIHSNSHRKNTCMVILALSNSMTKDVHSSHGKNPVINCIQPLQKRGHGKMLHMINWSLSHDSIRWSVGESKVKLVYSSLISVDNEVKINLPNNLARATTVSDCLLSYLVISASSSKTLLWYTYSTLAYCLLW